VADPLTDPVGYFENDRRGRDELASESRRHRDRFTGDQLFGQQDDEVYAQGGYEPTLDQLTPDYVYDDPYAIYREGPRRSEMGQARGEDYYVNEALRQLQQLSGQQGLSRADQAMIDAQQRQVSQQARSSREAQMQQAQARGMGSSGLAFMSAQQADEAGADRSADMRAQMMMGAQQRALQAMQAYGSLGSQYYGQSFGQDAARRNAIDDFNRWRTETVLGTQQRNTDQRNRAAEAESSAYQQRYNNRYGRYQDDEARRMGIFDRQRDERRYQQEREDGRTQALIDTGAGLVGGGLGGR